jgi:TPR repeat protein
MKKILLSIFVVLFTAATVFSGEFEDKLKKAEQGHAWAQYYLGLTYSLGQGVPQDYKQAAYWYAKAAEQGDAGAQFALSGMHFNGEGVTQDYKQAAYWCTKAAEQGNAFAQLNLGLIYFNGWGVPQDYKQAAHWYTKAAEQGHVDAQNNLGLMYITGQGVVQDYKQAYVWLNLAAAQGDEDAIEGRDIIAKELTPQQLSEAQELATKIQHQIDNPGNQETSSVAKPTPSCRAPTSTSADDVLWVQQTLKNLDYNPGPVDGVMGARTRDAIIAFQTVLDVAPTGVIDKELVALLRLMLKSE